MNIQLLEQKNLEQFTMYNNFSTQRIYKLHLSLTSDPISSKFLTHPA